jgi:uncharacterized Tic20 family protein
MVEHDAAPETLPVEVRNWAMGSHLSALTGVVTGIGFFAAPLVIWLLKRESHPFIDANGKEAVNFQFTMMLAMIVCIPLIFLIIGILLLPLIGLFDMIMSVVAGIKAANGETYRYPLTFRFLK